MTLSYTKHRGGRSNPVLTHCPVCNFEFRHGRSREEHFLEDHTPEDFGLSPLGGSASDD